MRVPTSRVLSVLTERQRASCARRSTHTCVVCHVEEKAARCHHLSGGCFPVQGECLPDRRLSISNEPSRSSRARRAARAPGVCRERTRVTRQVEGSISPPFTTTRGRTNFGRHGASPAARSLARGVARSPQRAPRPWSGSPPTRHTPQMRTEVFTASRVEMARHRQFVSFDL